MAEISYRRITEFDPASAPFDGTQEYIPVVQSGTTKRALWSGIFGSGWWTVLKAAFSSFVAPDALHATDADTLGGDTSSSYRDASNLTSGVLPLERIPAELTGKNAPTSTLAATVSVVGVSDNVSYPLALVESAGAGAKAIKSDTSGGTYNPSNNTAAINISGNAATATNATSATNATNADKVDDVHIKIVDIGDWNMDAAGSININVGVDVSKIREASVIIRHDSNTIHVPLNTASPDYNLAGYFSWNTSSPSVITLNRVTGGYFDSTSFDSTSYNRGWITIAYVD